MNVTEQITAADWLAQQQGKPLPSKSAPKAEPEHEMQCYIVQDFMTALPQLVGLLFAIPNGAKVPYRTIKKRNGQTITVAPERQKLLDEGMVPGIPDLMLAVPRGGWHGLFIENKILPNKPSPEQLERMQQLSAQGYLCHICHDRDYAAWIIQEYLSLPVTPSPNVSCIEHLRDLRHDPCVYEVWLPPRDERAVKALTEYVAYIEENAYLKRATLLGIREDVASYVMRQFAKKWETTPEKMMKYWREVRPDKNWLLKLRST